MGCKSSKTTAPSARKPESALDTKTLLGTNEVVEATKNKDHALSENVGLRSLPQTAESHGSQVAPGTKSTSTNLSGIKTTSTNLSNKSGNVTLNRQRTLCTDKHELDVMVMKFTCHDSTVGNAIGRNCKEMQWTVGYDRNAAPIDIKLHVQEHKLHSNEVRIESNGEAIFRGAGEHAKTKMIEDFCYQWPFRATIFGMFDRNLFEFHPPHSVGDSWFPATIVGQRADGLFEVLAQEPNQYGQLVEMRYPAVERTNLREASTRQPLMVPEDALIVQVPKQDPLHATLKRANGELVTHYFGRPSPALSEQERAICFKVSKDRSLVTADVGHGILTTFTAGTVQSISNDVQRLQRRWDFQLGPFAQHSVEITKNHTLGKIITLLVDGEVLVESTPAEIGCTGSEWQCTFKFFGERVMDFEVYKTNKDGTALDETDHVKHRKKYTHECKLVLPNDWDFHSAQLYIDGAHFTELPVKMPEREEKTVAMDPLVLEHTYGITAPYKVDHSAPSGILAFTQKIVGDVDVSKGVAGLLGSQFWQSSDAGSSRKMKLPCY